MAATIMAPGLTRAARPTTSTLMPKNTVTMATPMSAPISPLTPTRAALTATMIAAATAVSAPARRTTVAYFASITGLLGVRQQLCWPGGTNPPDPPARAWPGGTTPPDPPEGA